MSEDGLLQSGSTHTGGFLTGAGVWLYGFV